MGLRPLHDLLLQLENKALLAAATGAIWKCSISREVNISFRIVLNVWFFITIRILHNSKNFEHLIHWYNYLIINQKKF
jgi:hypothetical protein